MWVSTVIIKNPYKGRQPVHKQSWGEPDWVYLGSTEAIHEGDELPDDLWFYTKGKPILMRAWAQDKEEHHYVYADSGMKEIKSPYKWCVPWTKATEFDPYFQVAYERAKSYGYKLP